MTDQQPSDQGIPSGARAPVKRKANGQWAKGFSGAAGYDPARARKALNADTIREMHDAFRRGGRQAIDKVMRNNPAMFLKMLVLLVPREMQIEHSGGVKTMTDEQIEATISAIEQLLARRAAVPGDDAKVIDGEVLEPPPARRKRAPKAAVPGPSGLSGA